MLSQLLAEQKEQQNPLTESGNNTSSNKLLWETNEFAEQPLLVIKPPVKSDKAGKQRFFSSFGEYDVATGTPMGYWANIGQQAIISQKQQKSLDVKQDGPCSLQKSLSTPTSTAIPSRKK